MSYAPGTAVEWLDTATGQWHPGVVQFDCCHASEHGPFTQVEDELGWWHTCWAEWVRLPAAKVSRRRARRARQP